MTDPDPALSEPGNEYEPTDVIVIGGGLAGLTAGRDIARAGFSVTILEEADQVGAELTGESCAGFPLHPSAQEFTEGDGALLALLRDLDLADRVESATDSELWLRWPKGSAPMPNNTVVGIPAVPLADDVRSILGWSAAWRAQLDRYRPLLRVRAEDDFADLVHRRMGGAVLDRMVAPLVSHRFSLAPSEVDVHEVAPGLTQAMTVQGSLSGAVMALLEDTRGSASVRPTAGDVSSFSLRDGMAALAESLANHCRRYGARLLTSRRAVSVHAPGELDREPRCEVTCADGSVLRSRAVIIAVPQESARELLRSCGVTVAETVRTAPVQTIATVVLETSSLDSAPRGAGVLASSDLSCPARSVVHLNARWRWLSEALGKNRHMLQVRYADSAARASQLDHVVDDAATLLGVPLDSATVRSHAAYQLGDVPAPASRGRSSAIRTLADDLAEFPRVRVAGEWFDGPGLTRVVSAVRPRVLDLNARLRTS